MLLLNFAVEPWSATPEVATILYAAFSWRSKQAIRRCVDTSDTLLVARHYGCVAGFAMVRPCSASDEMWAYISWLAVAKCFRRLGVASAILDDVYARVGQNVLSVWNENAPALALYTKLGYEKYHVDKAMNFSWFSRR